METNNQLLLPMLSADQQVRYEDGLNTYMENIAGPLARIQGELHWHIHDLCRFHQLVYSDLNNESAILDKKYSAFRASFEQEKQNNQDDEILAIRASRIKSLLIADELVINRVKKFSDEFSVIGLWATAERYLGKVYTQMEHLQTNTPIRDIRLPYRWDDFVTSFQSKSINLSTLKGFEDANECRILNNTIKHAGFVNSRLGEFPFFTPHINKDLTEIDFDMQRYLNGIFNFLGSLIKSGNKLLDPSFPY